MDALRAWRASSHLLGLASASRARVRLTVRCCSSSSAASPTPTATSGTADRRRRSSTSTSDRESIRAIRLKKVAELRSKGYQPYAYKWDRSHNAKQLQDIYSHLDNGEECKEDLVAIAGRIVARRAFGKLAFLTIRDDSGTIQLYCEKESLKENLFEQLKTYVDIGDIVGASGSIKKTEKGELSIYVKFFEILTKSLLPLPDKYHGLTDVDKRYRQRYVDMIANPEVSDVFRIRAKIVSEIRKTMESSGFIEVETPVLQGAVGGAEARPFVTYHNSLGRDLYLRIATELHLKRMLVGGLEKVFEIGRIFRNEGISTRHNPEFTTIEMYEAYSDYQSMMNMAEEIATRCALVVHGKLNIDYQGTEICLQRPWRRETMHNLVKEVTGVDFNEFGNDVETAKEAARGILGDSPEDKNNVLIQTFKSVGHVLNEVFELLREQLWYKPNSGIYIKLIVMLGKCRQPERAHALFQAMIDEGCIINHESYTALVSAYSRSGLFGQAFSLLNKMKITDGCQPDVHTYSILIKSCLQFNEFDKVQFLLSDMEYEGIKPNTITYNTLIDAYGKAGRFAEMESTLMEMLRNHDCKPDVWTMNATLRAFGGSGQIGMMEKCYDKFQSSSISPNIKTFNVLLDSYGKSGKYEKMSSVMEYMQKYYFSWTVVTYNVVIDAFGRAGDLKQMEYLFRLMKSERIKPNCVTLCSLVRAYGRAEAVDKIKAVMRYIENSDVMLDTVFFNCLVDAYGRAGCLMEMREVLEMMKSRGCAPDKITYSTMIKAYLSRGIDNHHVQDLRDVSREKTVLPREESSL